MKLKKLSLFALAITSAFAADQSAQQESTVPSIDDKHKNESAYLQEKKSPVKVCYETNTPKNVPKLAA